MDPEAKQPGEIEAEFLAGVESRLNEAKGTSLPGTWWTWKTRSEEYRHRHLFRGRQPDRWLPKNKRLTLTGKRPWLLFGRRRSCVAIASVLSLLERYAAPESGLPEPIDLATLDDHVRMLAGEAKVTHWIGVCSPSGFSEDVRESGLSVPNVKLVLIEPEANGHWSVTPGSPDVTPEDCRLFDPETLRHKHARVRNEIRARSADLLMGGVSAASVAERLALRPGVVAGAFEKAAAADPELRISREDDEVLLYRGAPARVEDDEMSMLDRLRQLFTGEGDEARKINALSEQKTKLVRRRDRIYEDVVKLEKQEENLLVQGRDTTSPTRKRRIVAQINQLRDEMKRLNASARMLGQQVEVVSTQMHNLTLIRQGKMAKLPEQEKLADVAVRAEEMLEELEADVDLAGSLAAGTGETMMSDEEQAILAELEGPAPAVREETKPAPQASADERTGPARGQAQPERREPEAS